MFIIKTAAWSNRVLTYKKLSYCCDSRSYCMQYCNQLKQLLCDIYFNAVHSGAVIRAKQGTDRAGRS